MHKNNALYIYKPPAALYIIVEYNKHGQKYAPYFPDHFHGDAGLECDYGLVWCTIRKLNKI